MRKQQIIAIIVVLLLAAGAGAGYQFYFKPTLEKLAEDKQFLKDLNTKLSTLKRTFPTNKPDAEVAEVKAKIQPWEEALEQRARQFSIGAFKQIDPIPETRVLKSHYARQAQKIVGELYTEILTKQIYVNPRIDLYFGMPRPDSLGGKTVHPIEVMYWSTNIQFGASVMRLLLDSEVGGIDDLHVWTPKEADGFKSYPVGVSMWMTMSGFCKLVEKLQNDDTMTITIQGFSIRNTALRASQDPWLKIDMTFRFDEYDYKPKPASGQAAGDAASAPGGAASGDAALSGISGNRLAQIQAMRAASARNSSGSAGGGEASKPEESFWQKLWPF